MAANPTTLVTVTVARVALGGGDDGGERDRRQVLLTQTITYADYTTTAVVTLGNNGPTSSTSPAVAAPPTSDPSSPSSPSSTSSSSGGGGLSPGATGAIVGSILGAVLVALLIWLGCVVRRRMIEAAEEGEDEIVEVVSGPGLRYPHRIYRAWPRFPTSIPPPFEPTWVARPETEPPYTANDAARRATTSYIYYDDER